MGTGHGVLTDGVPGWRALGTAAVVIAALGAAACSGEPSPGEPGAADGWAAAAEAWAQAYEDSWGIGMSNAARFYAEGVEVDQRSLSWYAGTGPAGFVQNTRDVAQEIQVWFGGRDATDTITVTRNEPPYVSVDALVDPVSQHVAGMDMPIATYQHMSAQGIDEEVFAGSAQTGAEYAGMDRLADGIVARYLRAWGGADDDAAAAAYSPDARLRDSLLSVHVDGAEAIGALATRDAARGGLPGAALHIAGTVEDIWPDTPDYYSNGPADRQSVDRLVLLMDVPDSKGCTRAVAAVLWLDEEGLITREERLHRVDTVRTCAGEDPLPTGWWDEVPLPEAPVVRRTRGVDGPDGVEIALWNGAGLEPLVGWALQRFADAGLPPPTPTSITFLPPVDGDPWSTYGFLTGSDAPDIGVPVTRASACAAPDCATWTPQAKAAMLHELAHSWLRATDYRGGPSWEAVGARAEAFLAAQGLTWRDPAKTWAQQGTERAAETLAWGLMDQPHTVDARLGPLTCAELAQDFQTLTYSTPDPRACAEPGTTGTGTP